jgi:Glyoxalase-like domain
VGLEPDNLTFDCANPVRVAGFWAQVFGFEPDHDDPAADQASLADPSDGQATFWTVMGDVEGNEFCVVRGPGDGWSRETA